MERLKPKVLAVIPARGGSKRLPRKNIMKLCGRPLISYTIDAVKNATLITHWLVSTEDEAIKRVAQECRAPVPFIRPPDLATDTVRNVEVVLHALKSMEESKGITYDMIVLLQPTSPIRDATHIDEAIKKLWESDLPTLAAVKGPFQKRDPILKRINSDGNLIPYCTHSNPELREPFYIYNAALYAVKRDYFVNNKKLISDKQVPFIMDKFHSVDVDQLEDMLVAEAYLIHMKKMRKSECGS